VKAARAASPNRQTHRRRTTTRTPSDDGDESPWARKSLPDLEDLIIETEDRIAALEDEFADPDVYRDAERARRLRAEHERLRTDLAEMNRVWESFDR